MANTGYTVMPVFSHQLHARCSDLIRGAIEGVNKSVCFVYKLLKLLAADGLPRRYSELFEVI